MLFRSCAFLVVDKSSLMKIVIITIRKFTIQILVVQIRSTIGFCCRSICPYNPDRVVHSYSHCQYVCVHPIIQESTAFLYIEETVKYDFTIVMIVSYNERPNI